MPRRCAPTPNPNPNPTPNPHQVRAYSLVRHDVQTRHLVSQQPKPKAHCDPEHLATSRYRQTHHRLAPP
eukprot:scaffold2056_cov27-Phaeocystis_antarctica.AAC.1